MGLPASLFTPGFSVVNYVGTNGVNIPALVEARTGSSPPVMSLLLLDPNGYSHVNGVSYSADNTAGTWNYPVPSTDTVYFVPEDFGAVGDGVVDDTDALQAAINASLGTFFKRGTVLLGLATYRTTRELYVPPSLGFTMQGNGKWGSRILSDPTEEGTHTLVINSSQHTTLCAFGIFGLAANKTNYAIHYDYDFDKPGPHFASYGHVLQDIWITSENAGPAFEFGIVFSDNYGNNSEVNYWGVYITHFIEAAVWLPGTQQKAHIFYGCQVNGGWDGFAGSGVGGKRGIWTGGGINGAGGSFQYLGGGMSSCSEDGFAIEFPNDPIVLDCVQTENLYRFTGGASTAPGTARLALTIRGCRLDTHRDYDPTGYIKVPGVGPFVFKSNSMFAAQTTGETPRAGPQIHLAPGSPGLSAWIRGNYIGTADSAHYDLVINGSPFTLDELDMGDNIYVTNGLQYTIQPVAEFLHHHYTQPFGTALFRSVSHKNAGSVFLRVNAAAFTADATTESVKFFEIPRGTEIESMKLLQYDGFSGTGLEACRIDIGQTPGEDDYLTNLNGMQTQKYRGNLPEEVGEKLTNMVQGSYMPSWTNTTGVWATLTTTGMNLGDGEATNFATGYFFVELRLRVAQRFVVAA